MYICRYRVRIAATVNLYSRERERSFGGPQCIYEGVNWSTNYKSLDHCDLNHNLLHTSSSHHQVLIANVCMV